MNNKYSVQQTDCYNIAAYTHTHTPTNKRSRVTSQQRYYGGSSLDTAPSQQSVKCADGFPVLLDGHFFFFYSFFVAIIVLTST